MISVLHIALQKKDLVRVGLALCFLLLSYAFFSQTRFEFENDRSCFIFQGRIKEANLPIKARLEDNPIIHNEINGPAYGGRGIGTTVDFVDLFIPDHHGLNQEDFLLSSKKNIDHILLFTDMSFFLTFSVKNELSGGANCT